MRQSIDVREVVQTFEQRLALPNLCAQLLQLIQSRARLAQQLGVRRRIVDDLLRLGSASCEQKSRCGADGDETTSDHGNLLCWWKASRQPA